MRLPRRRRTVCCVGPGSKRYIVALLCAIGFTIVVGMRAEVMGIMANLNETAPDITVKKATNYFSKTMREKSWTGNIEGDLVENAVLFGHVLATPIGGLLTLRYDNSMLVGGSVFLTSGLNFFLPLVTTLQNLKYKVGIAFTLRFFQGICEACLLPGVYGLLRFWAPESEQATIVCIAVVGVCAGPLIGLPLCREIGNRMPWLLAFFLYGFLGVIWCIFWWRTVEERPTHDTHLHAKEWQYLVESIRKKVLYAKRGLRIPWNKLFRSRPIYAIVIAYSADDWTFQISSVCMQSYFRDLYDADVTTTVKLLSYPFLARSICVALGAIVLDLLRWKTSIRVITLYRILSSVGFCLKACFFIGLSFAETEELATILLTLALGFSGLGVASYGVNIFDLTPNYAGLVMGLATSISTLMGILSTVAATRIVVYASTVKVGWRIALLIGAGIQLIAATLYNLWTSTQDLYWSKDEAEVPTIDAVVEQPGTWRKA